MRVCNLLDSTFNINSPLKASKIPRISNILGLARLGLIPVLIVLIPYDSGINPDQYPKLGNIAKPGAEGRGLKDAEVVMWRMDARKRGEEVMTKQCLVRLS
jgi:hypothetical protein